MLDQKITDQARYWATSKVFDEATKKEVANLLEKNEEKELTDRFYRDLEFGTGGLRGILGAGTSRMNIYNIRKATTALATYLAQQFPNQERSVAISHDSRHFSRDFAKAAAEVLAANGIKVIITKELRPVPMLSFMVRHYKCQAGICVTASHNPPNYNGYKVYWATGGQLVPPHDKNIINIYGSITNYDSFKTMPYKDAMAKGLVKEVGAELDEEYFKNVSDLSMRKEGRDNFKIVYSPLHGAGLYPVTEMLKRYGFKDVQVVPEQREPDGNFPTVKSPNPEEPEALALARALALKNGADMIMATDPDCDRIGLEVRIGNSFFRPNGNQIACLLNEYVLVQLKETGKLPKDALSIKTVVTTDLQADIAHEVGASCEETLTGFKWICDVIDGYETGRLKPYKKFVCGGEESFGFMAGSFVRDKDGVISCCLAAEMTAYYRSKGKTLVDVLNDMYTRHGVYYETLHTLTLPGKEGAEKIKDMMNRMRNQPPAKIDGIAVKSLQDYELSKTFSMENGKPQPSGKLDLPRSDVLQFTLVDGTKVSVRPSGTEPKIKFYVSVKDPEGKGVKGEKLEAIKTRCAERAVRIEQIFVELSK
jgi:phosphoglucomutase